MKRLPEHGLGFPLLPLVLNPRVRPDGLWLSYYAIAAATRSAISTSRALVMNLAVRLRLLVLGSHRVGLVWFITYNRA